MKGSMCEFRAATEDDFEGIAALIKSEEELYSVYPCGEYPFTVDQVRALSQTRKELSVGVDDNAIVAFANLYNYEPGKHAFIGNVVVDKDRRDRGLGKAIIGYMLKMAHEKYDLPEVRISVFSENTPALLLYSGFGFVPYEIEQRENPLGEKVALIHMKKLR